MQDVAREPARRGYDAARGLGLLVLVAAALVLLSPLFERFDTHGFHDWDVSTAYRHVTTVSLLEYGEAPWWHPWLCGGFPAFGHPEGATNLVSPYLPLYLLTDVRVALRLEVLGATLTGLLGAFFLARRFTASAALCAFVALVAILNGRWSLQAAAGHTWHLQYAWLPWVLLLFDRSAGSGRLRDAALAGGCLALMVFMGGVYPAPHAALLLLVYAAALALVRRSSRPLLALAVAGATGLGFSAPKLAAVYDTLRQAPRLIESTEAIGPSSLLVMLTDRSQLLLFPPIPTPAYGWHEWGLYIGWVPLLCLLPGVLLARGPREQALKACALGLLVLGLGAFHAWSPWALLHRLPPFSSQHVPSRFHFPMLLAAGLLFASWAEGRLRRSRRRPRIEAFLLAAVALLAFDLAGVGRRAFATAFLQERPARIEAAARFEQRRHPTARYRVSDWAPPALLSMLANQGLIDCYGVPNTLRVGARGVEDPDYRGAAWVADGPGSAEVSDWSPNRALVRYQGARPGSLLVYNMNFDPSWRADGRPALEHGHAVAARLPGGDGTLEFRYVPRTLRYSLWLPALTLAGCLAVGGLGSRRRGA
jgi:hypothetical protein